MTDALIVAESVPAVRIVPTDGRVVLTLIDVVRAVVAPSPAGQTLHTAAQGVTAGHSAAAQALILAVVTPVG